MIVFMKIFIKKTSARKRHCCKQSERIIRHKKSKKKNESIKMIKFQKTSVNFQIFKRKMISRSILHRSILTTYKMKKKGENKEDREKNEQEGENEEEE